MHYIFDINAKKKSANLSLNSSLLAEAKRLHINLSSTLEEALSKKVRQRKEKQWLEDNKLAIDSCNDLVETSGMFSDAYRTF